MQNSVLIKNQSQDLFNQGQSYPDKTSYIKNNTDLPQGKNPKNINSKQITQNLNPPQNQEININQNHNNSNNAINTSTNQSPHGSQSSLQNLNLNQNTSSNLQGSANFPSKEYFNFQFFKRQMSSQSSDIDFGVDNKEGINDFFSGRFNSVKSKDSSKPHSNNNKNSVDRKSCDLDLNRENLSTKLENKDEQSQVFLPRANSASLKKSNYIPKTFYFQTHHNSTIPSRFYKNNNNNNYNNNEQNLVLKYYENNNEYNIVKNNNLNNNKLLYVINDKGDENEDEEGHEDKEDSDDDCIITSKEDDNFSINYLNRKSTENITLPKRTLTLVHRNSNNLLNLDKNSKEQENSNNNNDDKKKKLPPVKTNSYSGSSKNSLNVINNDEEKEKKEKNKDINKNKEEDKKNKDDSEYLDDSKSNNEEKDDNDKQNKDINKNENNINIKEKNNNNDSSENIPDLSQLKDFKIKKNNSQESNDNSNNNDDSKNENNNEISGYFFGKKNNLTQNQNNNINNLNNLNNVNMQKISQLNNNNNFIQYELEKSNNINIFLQKQISPTLMMGNANVNQLSNNYSLGNENQLIQGMQNLNSNNNFISNFNNLNLLQNNKNKNYPINPMIDNTEDLIQNAPNYIKDQTGCRYIQKKIDENPLISNKLFEILYQYLTALCRDLFGNYVVQKLLENVNPKYLIRFIELISNDFLNLATSTYGTRVIQKILEIVVIKNNIPEQDKEIYEQCFKLINNHITNDIVALSSNNNSSHIIIKYVNEIRYPNNIQLFNEVYKNFLSLCKDKHGCCVIQKCIEAGNQEQKNKLLELSNLNCENLISDQFGNYVIQFVVNLNLKIVNQKVCQVLKNNLYQLCKEKYASNVIEKFFLNKSEESLEIIDILLKNEKMLHELILDQFGNYIIQRILILVEGESRSLLIHYIVQWYPEIKTLSFGPRLISKLHERYQEFTILVTQKYGWDTTQETVSYFHLNNPKFKNNMNRNNFNNNINVNSFNNIYDNSNNNYIKMPNGQSQSEIFNNFGNNSIGNNVNNNSCMNFKNKSNVGNINFIQMNNYMLTPGLSNQNNQRLVFNNNNPLISNFNNINNLNNINSNINNTINNNQMINDMNRMNQGINNNLFYQREKQQNNYNDINNNIIHRINNNFDGFPFYPQYNNLGNNNQNILNYQRYMNLNFPNDNK